MKILKSDQGFTLVELMVVVAIIGVLAAVAIPNFKTYQAKAKTTESKLQLAAAYAAQVSFNADSDSYANCLSSMGYNPSNESASRYYSVGISAADTATRDTGETTINGAACGVLAGGAGASYFLGGKLANSDGTHVVANLNNAGFTTAADKSTFLVGAAGWITTSAAADGGQLDGWSIDENKNLRHTQVGY